MKPTKNKILIAFSALIILSVIVLVYLVVAINRPNSGVSRTTPFEINSGESLSFVASNLAKSHLINSESLFRLYAHFDKRGNDLKAGRYDLPGNLTVNELLDTFTVGPKSLRITFIEGWRREQMAAAFGQEDFIKASVGLEGFLFPDTYIVAQQASAASVVELMRETFDEKVTEKMRADFAAESLDLNGAVTLASLVEREAVTDTDRRMVAGILMNRLRDGWFLGVDASVQYAVSSAACLGVSDCTWWPTSLSAADLKIVSPYNTYTNKGLPPAPVCNPSLSALQAVAEPTQSDYFYYLTGKDGQFHYAVTQTEHDSNIAKFL
jgi:UPF0755 protein